MWSDDSDGSQSPIHQHGNGEGSSSQAGSPSTNSSTATQCEPLMDLDDDLVSVLNDRDQPLPSLGGASPANNHPFLNDFMSEADDDDDLGNGGAQIDILSITNVLTHGLTDLDDGDDPLNLNIPDAGQDASGPVDLSGHSPWPTSVDPLPPLTQEWSYGPTPPLTSENNSVPHFNGNPLLPQFTPQGNQPNNSNGHHIPLLHHPQQVNIFGSLSATALGPENYNLSEFVRAWAWQAGAWQGLPRERGRYPWASRIDQQLAHSVSHVDYMDLEGDRYDVQGLDWEDLGVTRSEARERRLNTYKNYVNIANSDRWQVGHFDEPEHFVYVR